MRTYLAVFKADLEKAIDKAFNRLKIGLFIITVAIIVIVKFL